MKRFSAYLICLVLCVRVFAEVTSVSAITPEVQTASWAKSWWMPRHEVKLAEAKVLGKGVELLFIGDSITQGWEGQGQGVWELYYGRRHAFNLGFSGDRTEQVLWRLQHGAVDELSPKAVVLMIGTNNTGHRQDPAEQTVAGIKAILAELKTRLPQTKILLLAIFPREANTGGGFRKLNTQINKQLPALADHKQVFFLDINHVFRENDGRLRRHIMPDLLHLNSEGYRLWAEAMEPMLQKLLVEKVIEPKSQVLTLWPQEVPGEVCNKPEQMTERGNVTRITNISVPTLTLFQVHAQKKPSPAVLVCPGGGYHIVCWDKEGTEIAQWFNSIGYTAAILKYRVPKNRGGALQDAQRALGMMRYQAKAWHIDPHMIGVLGFSAGGHLAATLSNQWSERSYPAVDKADAVSCRPDFTVLVYPAYLGANDYTLIDEVKVTKQTPPAFIVQTQDDRKYVASSTAYYLALSQVGIDAELHLYPHGGHGFGLRPSAYPVSHWPQLCEAWLKRLLP